MTASNPAGGPAADGEKGGRPAVTGLSADDERLVCQVPGADRRGAP